jgi:type VI protein secretion system component VasF
VLRLAVSLLSGLREAVPESLRSHAGQAAQIRTHAARCKATWWLALLFVAGRVLLVAARGSWA